MIEARNTVQREGAESRRGRRNQLGKMWAKGNWCAKEAEPATTCCKQSRRWFSASPAELLLARGAPLMSTAASNTITEICSKLLVNKPTKLAEAKLWTQSPGAAKQLVGRRPCPEFCSAAPDGNTSRRHKGTTGFLTLPGLWGLID